MVDERHDTVIRCQESFFASLRATVILRHKFSFLSFLKWSSSCQLSCRAFRVTDRVVSLRYVPSNGSIASDAFVGCDSQGCRSHSSVLPLSLRPRSVSHCSRHFQVVVALFAREPADSRRESVAAPSMGCRFATSIGMATHISVPAPVLLQTANLALMFSARSRIPRRPQCESHSL